MDDLPQVAVPPQPADDWVFVAHHKSGSTVGKARAKIATTAAPRPQPPATWVTHAQHHQPFPSTNALALERASRAPGSPAHPRAAPPTLRTPAVQLLVATLCAAASRPTITYTFREPLVVGEKGKPLCHFLLKIYNEDVRSTCPRPRARGPAVAHPSLVVADRLSNGSASCAARVAHG